MSLLHSSPSWRRLAAALAAGAAVLLTSACASGGGASSSADGASAGTSRGSVEVFGVIDAGVSHVTNKSERR